MSEAESEATETEETEAKAPAGGSRRPPNQLTKDSDVASRPGFRQPANERSKASRRKKRKKR